MNLGNNLLLVLPFSDQGEVFVWGYGILGKGPKLSESSTPEMIPPTLFGRSDFSPSVRVCRIRCGLNHFAAVTGENQQASVCESSGWDCDRFRAAASFQPNSIQAAAAPC